MSEDVEWKDIPGWDGYFASSAGEIRGRLGRPLTPYLRRDGYMQVALFDGSRKVARSVHTLVCLAFHGPRPSDAHQAAHGDGERTHNAASNLRWATPEENRQDIRAHGRVLSGQDHPRARLTNAQATEIRRRYAEAMGARYVRRGTRQALAIEFGVPLHVIKDLVGGRSWASVTGEAAQ